MAQYFRKYWYTLLTLLAIDVCVVAYFLSNGGDVITYSGILSCLYLIVMPAMGVYNKIFENRFLTCWMILNAIVMGVYVISVVKVVF